MSFWPTGLNPLALNQQNQVAALQAQIGQAAQGVQMSQQIQGGQQGGIQSGTQQQQMNAVTQCNQIAGAYTVQYISTSKYSGDDWKHAIGMDTNKGKILESNGLNCKVYCYNSKKEVYVQYSEIIDIPELDRIKESKLYKIAFPPVQYEFLIPGGVSLIGNLICPNPGLGVGSYIVYP